MNRYKYDQDTLSALNKLEDHLRSKYYSIHSIRQIKNYTSIFLKWLNENNLTPEEVTYKTITEFMYEGIHEYTLNHSRRIVLAVRHYYDSLEIDNNPVSGIYIRGMRKSILNDIVTYKELLEMFYHYKVYDDRTRRNKVILSLFIYQAITTGELHQLEPSQIKLKEGKIYVPGHGDTNSRLLDLDASQLLDLQEYLLLIRPRMLENVHAYRSGRRPSLINAIIYDKLFFSENGSDNLKDTLLNLFKSIQKTHYDIKSAKTIRSTVLAEWLKTKDLRIVQYMAGHRYVSSTERYNVFNMQELKDALNRYHPLK